MLKQEYIRRMVACGFDETIAEMVCEHFEAEGAPEATEVYVEMIEELYVGKIQP